MMQLIKKTVYLLLLIPFPFSGNAQIPSNIGRYMQGRWKIVLHDYRGYEKFSPSQAEQIEKSDLIITTNSYYYEGVEFIDTCYFAKWTVNHYDTSIYYTRSIERKYPKMVRAKFLRLLPVQENGSFNCYNECNTFFLKQDTLINICGGYTYYLIKSRPNDSIKNYPK